MQDRVAPSKKVNTPPPNDGTNDPYPGVPDRFPFPSPSPPPLTPPDSDLLNFGSDLLKVMIILHIVVMKCLSDSLLHHKFQLQKRLAKKPKFVS